MKRKQLYAFLLTGALTVSMMPAAVFAAEEAAVMTIENTDTVVYETAPEDVFVPAEETEMPAEEPAAEVPEEAADPGYEVPEEPAAMPDQTLMEEPEATPEPTPEETKIFVYNGTAYGTLEEAIAATPDLTSDDNPAVIAVNDNLTLGSTITVPAGKNVAIAAPAGKDLTISRGAGFKESLFSVAGSLYLLGEETIDESGTVTASGSLTIDGTGDGSVSDGALVSVAEDGYLVLRDNAVLKGNKSSASGGAVDCISGMVVVEGGSITGNSTAGYGGGIFGSNATIVLRGGSITGNTAALEGGGIYSDFDVYVSGTVNVTGNTAAESLLPSNLVLDCGEGEDQLELCVEVENALESSSIGLKVLNPVEGSLLINVASDIGGISASDMISQFTYEGDEAYKINPETGVLESATAAENLELKLTSVKWNSTNGVVVTGSANQNSEIYVKAVKQSAAAPTAEEMIAATKTVDASAGVEFNFKYIFSAAEKQALGTDPVTIYVCAKNKETGETSIQSQNMEESERGPRVSGVDAEWTGQDSALITCSSDKDGAYYVTSCVRGASPSAIDFTKEGVSVVAGQNFQIPVSGLDQNNPVDIYIYVKGKNGVVSSGLKVQMSETSRPPIITSGGSSWTSYNSAAVACTFNKDAYYWVTWAKQGEVPAALDFTKNGVKITGGETINIPVTGLAEGSAIDVYVYGSVNGKAVTELKVSLDQASRPAKPDTPSREPIVPNVSESVVTGLENPLEFYPNTFYDFTVIGAGTDNNSPVEGDVRWVPLYWSTSQNPSTSEKHTTWKIGAKNGISAAATYNMYIFYRQEQYSTTFGWQATGNVVSQTYQFRSANIAYASPTPTPYYDASTGTYYDQYGNPVSYTGEAADDTTSTGESVSANAANTADEAPVGTMSLMAVLSLLAGGYVIVRKRKREF